MNTIRSGLYSKLAGDTTLGALLASPTAIYHRRAPQTARTPFVIFHKQAGTPSWTFAGPPLLTELWMVKIIDRSSSASAAENAAARVVELLTDATLVTAGKRLLYIRHESDVDYGEDDGAELYQHVGALWRVITEPA